MPDVEHSSSSRDASQETPAPIQASYEDEVTSVVNTDIHRAHSRDNLDDRVVEQTSLGPDDESHAEDDDERFGLLARGGRDSVSQARSRMLRRRSGPQDAPLAEDTHQEERGSDATAAGTNFPPDDFIEEEAPSPESSKPPVESSASDDVILNEGVTRSTPRSRRLRRAGEGPIHPKREAVAETEPEVERPTDAPTRNAAAGQDRFDSVPEVSAGIDLSRLRNETRHDQPRTPQVSTEMSPADSSPVEEPFELAIRNARAIKAAARNERHERPRPEQRPRVAARREPDLAPIESRSNTYAETRSSIAIQDDLDPQTDHEPVRNEFQLDQPETQSSRPGVSTRDFGDHHFSEHDDVDPEFYDEEEYFEEERMESAPRETYRQDARSSWWRGLFQSRRHEDERATVDEDAWADEYDVRDQDVTYIAASKDSWDDTDNTDWDDNAPYDDRDDFANSNNVRAEQREIPDPDPDYEPMDLQHEQGMSSFRNRLFSRTDDIHSPPPPTESVADDHQGYSSPRTPITLRRPQAMAREESTLTVDRTPETRQPSADRSERTNRPLMTGLERARRASAAPALAPEALLESPDDAWHETREDSGFDVRNYVAHPVELLDMTIEISPEIPRDCASCRSYRLSEKGERGWCTNNWAFTHRQMVNATDLACQSTIGCWWLPADEEVWLIDDEPERGATPRVDRLIAHLDPLKRAVGR